MKYDIEYYTKQNGSLMSHDVFNAETDEEAKAKAEQYIAEVEEAEYAIVSDQNDNTFTVEK